MITLCLRQASCYKTIEYLHVLGLARYLEWLHEVLCKQTSDMQYLPITENSITPQ